MTRMALIAILLTALAQAAQPQPPGPAIGAAAPAFKVVDDTGVNRALSDYAGKIVVLEWHARSCSYSNKHYRTGAMQKLQQSWMDRGVVWLLVNSSGPDTPSYQTPEESRAYRAERTIAPTAMLLDADGVLGRAYGAQTALHVAIVDARGRVAYVGAIDDQPRIEAASVAGAKNYVGQALTELTAGKPVSVARTEPYGCSLHYASPKK
jgi:peroxiredoxin